MRFSKTTGCFYPKNINYSSLPADVVEVTDDDYSLASSRASDEDVDLVGGKIVIVKRPGPTNAELWADYQQSAREALNRSEITVSRIAEAVALVLTTWTAADVVAFMQYRRDLRAILSQPQPDAIPSSLPTKPPYPEGT